MDTLAYAIFGDEQAVAKAVDALAEHEFTSAEICVLRGSKAVDSAEGAVLVGVMTEDRERIAAVRTALMAAGALEVHVRARREAREELERAHQQQTEQRIDEALDESFPASDPPFWTSGWNGPPTPTRGKR